TLILLSVITFMAITLLVVTHSERNSVSTGTDQNNSLLAADNATEQAKVRMIAPSLAFTNPYSIDMMVSTNFINGQGFFPNNSNPTNVNYDFVYPPPAVPGGNATRLTAAQQIQNMQNLQYEPRAPVWMTNRLAGAAGSNEFRYYLDLNRNGK